MEQALTKKHNKVFLCVLMLFKEKQLFYVLMFHFAKKAYYKEIPFVLLRTLKKKGKHSTL
jgi:hypothetical protein